MNERNQKTRISKLILPGLAMMLLIGCTLPNDIHLNRAVYFTSNPGSSQQISTVNGTIDVDRDTSAGALTSFNGDINVGRHSHVNGVVANLNGKINNDGGEVYGDIITTNGDISLHDSSVSGSVQSFNGAIVLANTRASSVNTTNGDVRLSNTVLSDSLVVQGDSPLLWKFGRVFRKPVIDIGPNTEIKGDILINRRATLYVHESAIFGDIHGAQAIHYSGNTPGQ